MINLKLIEDIEKRFKDCDVTFLSKAEFLDLAQIIVRCLESNKGLLNAVLAPLIAKLGIEYETLSVMRKKIPSFNKEGEVITANVLVLTVFYKKKVTFTIEGGATGDTALDLQLIVQRLSDISAKTGIMNKYYTYGEEI
jgi:hypothetical protein